MTNPCLSPMSVECFGTRCRQHLFSCWICLLLYLINVLKTTSDWNCHFLSIVNSFTVLKSQVSYLKSCPIKQLGYQGLSRQEGRSYPSSAWWGSSCGPPHVDSEFICFLSRKYSVLVTRKGEECPVKAVRKSFREITVAWSLVSGSLACTCLWRSQLCEVIGWWQEIVFSR